MNQTNKNTPLKVIGVILIIVGIIMFIISAVQLYDVQTTTTHWAERFMQDYQARTNATNSIPCYMFMALAVVMVIAGIIMLCIKPKANVIITPPDYGNSNPQAVTYCPNCKNPISSGNVFCHNCGCKINKDSQSFTQKLICPNCGQKNESASKFCVKCGNKLQ